MKVFVLQVDNSPELAAYDSADLGLEAYFEHIKERVPYGLEDPKLILEATHYSYSAYYDGDFVAELASLPLQRDKEKAHYLYRAMTRRADETEWHQQSSYTNGSKPYTMKHYAKRLFSHITNLIWVKEDNAWVKPDGTHYYKVQRANIQWEDFDYNAK